MRVSLSLASFFFASQVAAFTPAAFSPRASVAVHDTAKELGIPCEDECALECFPNLPPSIHPGVLSGQAQMDLLQHAKENGKILSSVLFSFFDFIMRDISSAKACTHLDISSIASTNIPPGWCCAPVPLTS